MFVKLYISKGLSESVKTFYICHKCIKQTHGRLCVRERERWRQ